jgi:hypothetical protein
MFESSKLLELPSARLIITAHLPCVWSNVTQAPAADAMASMFCHTVLLVLTTPSMLYLVNSEYDVAMVLALCDG